MVGYMKHRHLRSHSRWNRMKRYGIDLKRVI
jgi:hypothetical protein